MSDLVIVVHGGAGKPFPEDVSCRIDEAMRKGLRDALAAGHEVLAQGGSALDAVERSVRRLEADAVFNAGRGSVLNAHGGIAMDAAIMSGVDRKAGAIAAVPRVVHPITAARRVMEDTDHVLLVGEGALAFCKEKGLRIEDEAYFVTDIRKRQLEHAKRERLTPTGGHPGDSSGTVGAVALDGEGNLAAATSTGGVTNQLPGRVGDSPLIGAGTWADNETCAVSATGTGEVIIRTSFAHNIDARIRYKRLALSAACREVMDAALSLGGEVGCISVNRHGHVAMPFSTSIMARGIMRSASDVQVAVGRSESLSGVLDS
ncbi:MAG: isoaspartyl peptidase/L-asparaginase [Myxococcales bacterium]|nr:isoaspartyl peptidase/L-asparaginase [Myxococcales bacterium]